MFAPHPSSLPSASSQAGRLVAVLAVGLIFVASSGCASSTSTQRFQGSPGSSFAFQMDQLRWSLYELFFWETPAENWQELKEDTGEFVGGTSLTELGTDAQEILWDPKALDSMQEDLGTFFDPEPGQMQETFELLGW